MANYSLVINSKFRPFSYDEMLKPVHASTVAHMEQEQRLAEQEDLADKIASLINKEKDPIAYARYESFINDLQARAVELGARGIKMGDYRKFLDLRSNYNKNLLPIIDLYQKRENEINRQRTADENNPTIVRSRNASDISIDELLANPDALNEIKSVRGDLLASQVNTAASALAKQIAEYSQMNPNDPKTKELGYRLRKLFPYSYLMFTQKGLTASQIDASIRNDANAVKELVNIIDNVVDTSGAAEWATPEQMKAIRGYASQGAWGAAGETGITPVQDQYGMRMAEIAAQEAANRRLEGLRHANNMRQQAAAQQAQQPRMRGVRANLGSLWGKGEKNPLSAYVKSYSNGRIVPDYGKMAAALGVSTAWLKKNLWTGQRLATPEELTRRYEASTNAAIIGVGKLGIAQKMKGTIPYTATVSHTKLPATSTPYVYNSSGMRNALGNPGKSQIRDFNAKAIEMMTVFRDAGVVNGQGEQAFRNSINSIIQSGGGGAKSYATYYFPNMSQNTYDTIINRAGNNMYEYNSYNGKEKKVVRGSQTKYDPKYEKVTDMQGVIHDPNSILLTLRDSRNGASRRVVVDASQVLPTNAYQYYTRYMNNARTSTAPEVSLGKLNYQIPEWFNQNSNSVNLWNKTNMNPFYTGAGSEYLEILSNSGIGQEELQELLNQ